MSNTKTRKRKDIYKAEKRTAFGFISPMLIGFTVFTLISLIAVMFFSLTDYNLMRDEYTFIGFKNYVDLFTNPIFSTAFIRSCLNTVVLLIGVPVGMVAGLALAVMLQAKAVKKGSKIFQVLYYIPAVTGVVAVNLVFKYVFNPEYGLINSLLDARIPWFSDDWLIKVAIIVKNTWSGMGGTMIMFLAGMNAIPQSYYEAAEIDGASASKRFFKITLPLLSPTTFYLLITGVIGGLQSYADAQVFAAGANGSQTIVYFIWSYGINSGRQGLASAASLILAVFIFIMTMIQFRISNRWVYDN